MSPVASSLKVGCGVRASTRVVVLLEIRLEWRSPSTVLRLVAKRSAGVEVQIIIVGSHLILALPHAPENECDAAKEQGTANAANDTTNDLLVRVAQAVAAVGVLLRGRHNGRLSFTGGDGDGLDSGNSGLGYNSIRKCCSRDGGKWPGREGDKRGLDSDGRSSGRVRVHETRLRCGGGALRLSTGGAGSRSLRWCC